ncbi:MAG: VWA domain-containing protein [Armatimonadetes bacterium]|nr:VWA domain-containing protein [Armatimonadota bacterium]
MCSFRGRVRCHTRGECTTGCCAGAALLLLVLVALAALAGWWWMRSSAEPGAAGSSAAKTPRPGVAPYDTLGGELAPSEEPPPLPEDPWPDDTLGKLEVDWELRRDWEVYRPAAQRPPKRSTSREPLKALDPLPRFDPALPNRVQVALLVDSSLSMKEAMTFVESQATDQLNKLSKLRRNGKPVQLELASYEYGTLDIAPQDGYVRQLLPFTADTARVFRRLRAVRSSGGDEYHGWVVRSALEDLSWTGERGQLRIIFLVGNEPFNQGPVDAHEQISQARNRGIEVYRIYCGSSLDAAFRSWTGHPMEPPMGTFPAEDVFHAAAACGYLVPVDPSPFQAVAREARELAATPGISAQLKAELELLQEQAEALAQGKSDDFWKLAYNASQIQGRGGTEPLAQGLDRMVRMAESAEKHARRVNQ